MVTLDARDVGSPSAGPIIRRYTPDDLEWASDLLGRSSGRLRIRRGIVVDTATLPGLVATEASVPIGLVTVLRHPGELELAVIATDGPDLAVVGMMIDAATERAGGECRRVFAICSNAEFDLQKALQWHGFRLCAVRPGSIESAATRLSPGQVVTELDGVPVRDELEFDLLIR